MSSDTRKQIFIIIEDHDSSLIGTKSVVEKAYPQVEVMTAKTSQRGLELIQRYKPHLVITDLVLPEKNNEIAKSETGRKMLRTLFAQYPELKILVQSAEPESLIYLKSLYEQHSASFAIVNKKQPMEELLSIIHSVLTIPGFLHTPPEIRRMIELRKEWVDLLKLAFRDGLKDSAIAKEMNVSERTVQNYYQKLRDALGVYLEEGQSMKEQLAIRARELGYL